MLPNKIRAKKVVNRVEHIVWIDRASARYISSSAQAIPNAAETTILYPTKDYDTAESVSQDGSSWKFKANASGMYKVIASVEFAKQESGGGWQNQEKARLSIYKGETQISKLDKDVFLTTDTRTAVKLQGSDDVYLEDGDEIEIKAYQDSGSEIALSGDEKSNFVIVKYN
jgi:hypothetical protein